MPHIVHLSTVHGPFDTRIFQKECRTLVQAGHRVSLLVPHNRRETADGVEIIPLPRITRRWQRILLAPWNAFRAARALSANLYHFHDPELLLVGLLLKWTTRAKVVYDAHENYTHQMSGRDWMPRVLKKSLPRFVGAIEQFVVKQLDAVIGATEHIAAQFSPAKARVLRNYPLPVISQPQPDARQYEPDNHTVIYTGGWTEHRGVYQIIQALAYTKTPDVTLLLLGKCVSPALQQRAEQLPGYKHVNYVGTVSFEAVYAHMRQAAIGLVCNQPEHDYEMAQPNKLFEYMSAHLPVIASHFPLWKEVIEGNHCGLTVDPTTPNQIAQAIDTLLAQPEKRRHMGENGYRATQTIYTWDAESKKLIALYKDLLSC